MKFQTQSAIIGAALSLPFSIAIAQEQSSVQVYGLIDTSIQSVNQASGRTAVLSTGDSAGSRIGFKGSESLSPDLKTIFVIENGFDSTTGGQLQSRLFGRQTYVGLADKTYGTLTLGRQATLMVDWASKYNAFDSGVFSTKDLDSAFSDRADNTIKYSNTFGPVTLAGYYSRSWNDTTGAENMARLFGGGLKYVSGDFDTALMYHKKHADKPATGASESNQESRIIWGAKYKTGAITWLGGYRWLEQELTNKKYNSNLVWGGLKYKLNAPVTLSASVYHLKGTTCTDVNVVNCAAKEFAGSDRKATMFVLGSEYAFSKRTAVYAMGAYMVNSDHTAQSVLGTKKYGDNVEPGKNQLGLSIGLRHTF